MAINKNGDIWLADDCINESEDYNFIRSTFNKPIGGTKSARLHTEIEFYNELGEKLETLHNELLLTGGLFTLSKISGVNAPIKPKTVNQQLSINVNETSTSYTGPRREDVICGFMVGIDGCTDVFDTVGTVYYKDRTIYSPVPFRKVEITDDLSDSDKQKYHMKVQNGTYYEYFLKGFETTPVIKAEYDEVGNPSVPANADEQDKSKIINTYIQYTLKINAQDVRDWFKISGGGLKKARINTLGLVHGYMDGSDFKGVNMFSRLNFNNEPFDNETKELTVIYKIYI